MKDDKQSDLNQPVFDYEDFLERIDGDTALLKEVLAIFLEDTPSLFSDLNTGIKNRDSEAIERAAHTLKGAAANISAKRLRDLSHQLLLLTRKGELAYTENVYDNMVKNYNDLEILLTSYLAK
jgi:two-component system sensor histidine kinase/response regulator